jgi:hypothetical protein
MRFKTKYSRNQFRIHLDDHLWDLRIDTRIHWKTYHKWFSCVTRYWKLCVRHPRRWSKITKKEVRFT